jgi:hypothetical protein
MEKIGFNKSMKDKIAKAKGLPFSTSRSQEKAAKKNTIRARRQDGKKQITNQLDN